MTEAFRLLMIGAMYENGGNTTHRFLDGHEELFVYPFESQPGTRHVNDLLASVYPVKYRWPVFALDARPEDDYRAIIDEECKVRARTPHVSKFRHVPFDFSDDERCARYVDHVRRTGRSRGDNMAAFFRSTFEVWKNHRASGKERVYVGYSPIITVDAERILADLPSAHFVHVVRNPWSAYADTKKRPVPLSLDDYMLGWSLTQRYALLARERHPDRMHIIRIEDVLADSSKTLTKLTSALGLAGSDALRQPSWNGEPLDEIYPWGTIRVPTPEANRATGLELSESEHRRVREGAGEFLDPFGYDDIPRG
jgi:hypothetical protein